MDTHTFGFCGSLAGVVFPTTRPSRAGQLFSTFSCPVLNFSKMPVRSGWERMLPLRAPKSNWKIVTFFWQSGSEFSCHSRWDKLSDFHKSFQLSLFRDAAHETCMAQFYVGHFFTKIACLKLENVAGPKLAVNYGDKMAQRVQKKGANTAIR